MSIIENRKIYDIFDKAEIKWLTKYYSYFKWTFSRTPAGVFKVTCTSPDNKYSISKFIEYPFDLFDLKREIDWLGAIVERYRIESNVSEVLA